MEPQHTTKFALSQDSLAQLRARTEGTVITADDPGYDEARGAWNLNYKHQPSVIVLPVNAVDIVLAVRFARDEGMGIAVQATGHGVAQTAAEGDLLIVTSRMNHVDVDAKTQTAWIEAGVQWGAVLKKAQAHGLAPLLGSSPDVAAVGYTLGGGMGWLARQYGMAVDSVNYFEVVTGDGRLVRASAANNSDLFWALCGGGGSFGVVTGMEIKLYPVTSVYGGNLYYPADMAKDVFTRYRDWIATAPEALTSSVLIMNYPPIPQIPEFLRGQTFVQVRGCYCGPAAEGEALLRYWRDWHAPIIDDFKAMSFADVATISNDPVDPTPGLATSIWLRDLNDDAIDILVQHGVDKQTYLIAEIRHAGGAIARVDAQANAYGNRDAQHILEIVAITPTPEIWRYAEQAISGLKQELRPHATGGVYINFLEGEEKRARTKDAFSPENYQRLMQLKAKYDPSNLFRFSFDIPLVS